MDADDELERTGDDGQRLELKDQELPRLPERPWPARPTPDGRQSWGNPSGTRLQPLLH